MINVLWITENTNNNNTKNNNSEYPHQRHHHHHRHYHHHHHHHQDHHHSIIIFSIIQGVAPKKTCLTRLSSRPSVLFPHPKWPMAFSNTNDWLCKHSRKTRTNIISKSFCLCLYWLDGFNFNITKINMFTPTNWSTGHCWFVYQPRCRKSSQLRRR